MQSTGHALQDKNITKTTPLDKENGPTVKRGARPQSRRILGDRMTPSRDANDTSVCTTARRTSTRKKKRVSFASSPSVTLYEKWCPSATTLKQKPPERTPPTPSDAPSVEQILEQYSTFPPETTPNGSTKKKRVPFFTPNRDGELHDDRTILSQHSMDLTVAEGRILPPRVLPDDSDDASVSGSIWGSSSGGTPGREHTRRFSNFSMDLTGNYGAGILPSESGHIHTAADQDVTTLSNPSMDLTTAHGVILKSSQDTTMDTTMNMDFTSTSTGSSCNLTAPPSYGDVTSFSLQGMEFTGAYGKILSSEGDEATSHSLHGMDLTSAGGAIWNTTHERDSTAPPGIETAEVHMPTNDQPEPVSTVDKTDHNRTSLSLETHEPPSSVPTTPQPSSAPVTPSRLRLVDVAPTPSRFRDALRTALVPATSSPSPSPSPNTDDAHEPPQSEPAGQQTSDSSLSLKEFLMLAALTFPDVPEEQDEEHPVSTKRNRSPESLAECFRQTLTTSCEFDSVKWATGEMVRTNASLRTSCQELSEELKEKNPSVFHSIQKASGEDLHSLQEKLRSLYSYCSAEARRTWYEWRTKLEVLLETTFAENATLLREEKANVCKHLEQLRHMLKTFSAKHGDATQTVSRAHLMQQENTLTLLNGLHGWKPTHLSTRKLTLCFEDRCTLHITLDGDGDVRARRISEAVVQPGEKVDEFTTGLLSSVEAETLLKGVHTIRDLPRILCELSFRLSRVGSILEELHQLKKMDCVSRVGRGERCGVLCVTINGSSGCVLAILFHLTWGHPFQALRWSLTDGSTASQADVARILDTVSPQYGRLIAACEALRKL